MNNQRLACYYSVVRFCPYPETDEFVNVGVILACPSVGFLDFKRSRRKLKRVNDFFPEIDPQVFSSALQSLNDALLKRVSVVNAHQLHLDSKRLRDDFLSLVRPRESILYFSEARVIMSHTPAETLDELYAAYVDRRFAHQTEYQETQMCRRLETLLQAHQLINVFQRDKAVGDDVFRVNFPFVRFDASETTALRAIKALSLDKKEPTDVFRHADSWRNNIHRLRDFGTAPKDLLFVLHPPAADKTKHLLAFDKIKSEFDNDRIPFVTEDRTNDLLDFAKQA